MTDRRTFLRASFAALGAARLSGLAGPGKPAWDRLARETDRLERIGIQLYTLRDEMRKDVQATLARVAAMGYHEVEFAGYFDQPPAALGTFLRTIGLDAPSAHVQLADVRARLPHLLEAAVQVGHRYLVVVGVDGRDRTLDGLKRVADDLNRAGFAAQSAGIQLAYHNYNFEFTPVDRVVPFELLLRVCDPNLVKFQMDLFWTTKGKGDPLLYFRSHPGRFVSVHVKDMAADGSMVDVGEGTLPFAKYFTERKLAGIKHFFFEHDEAADPFASAEKSLAYLKKLEF